LPIPTIEDVIIEVIQYYNPKKVSLQLKIKKSITAAVGNKKDRIMLKNDLFLRAKEKQYNVRQFG
jgi:hypothetical protein